MQTRKKCVEIYKKQRDFCAKRISFKKYKKVFIFSNKYAIINVYYYDFSFSFRKDIDFVMDNKKRRLLIAGLIVLLTFIIVGIIILCVALKAGKDNSKDTDKIVPDYPPQATDPNQSPMVNDPGGTLETELGGAGVNLTYTATATVDLSEGKVTLYYANPSKSTQDMVVSLVLDNGDVVLCRSQRITAGNQIRELTLEDSAREALEIGGYNARYVVGCYDPNTNEKAVVELVGGGVVVTVVE